MAELSISLAWDEAKGIIARDGRLLAAVALALIVLPEVVLAVVGVPIGSQATTLSSVIYVAVILFGFIGQIALNRLAIGPSVTVADAISQGFIRLIPVFLVLLAVIVGVGVIAILIAAILGGAGLVVLPTAGQPPPPSLVGLLILLTALAIAVFQLAFPIAAIETGNPLRLLSRSWQLARGHYLRLLAFALTVFIGLSVVVLVTQFGIGSLILLFLGPASPGSVSALLLGLIAGTIQACFTAVAAVMLARIYVQLSGRGRAEPGVPTTGI
jgi:hypothetical protein